MLAPDQWARVRSLLEEIMARPAEERAAYLAAANINEPDIRREVESLLRAHDDAGDFLEAPPRLGPDPLKQQQLGDFVIGREIGRGGMGVVYEARQMSLNRLVALKVLYRERGLDPAGRCSASAVRRRPPPSCTTRTSSRSTPPANRTARTSTRWN